MHALYRRLNALILNHQVNKHTPLEKKRDTGSSRDSPSLRPREREYAILPPATTVRWWKIHTRIGVGTCSTVGRITTFPVLFFSCMVHRKLRGVTNFVSTSFCIFTRVRIFYLFIYFYIYPANRKAAARVKRARDSLGALVGPFRLSKAVNDALKRGMLMPFPVSVQRGKAAAKLERGRKMREVSVRERALRVLTLSCALSVFWR